MSFKEWWDRMVGRTSIPASENDEAGVLLDARNSRTADTLSRLTKTKRDDVFNEAYRRARLLEDERSFRKPVK